MGSKAWAVVWACAGACSWFMVWVWTPCAAGVSAPGWPPGASTYRSYLRRCAVHSEVVGSTREYLWVHELPVRFALCVFCAVRVVVAIMSRGLNGWAWGT